jgi:hypothetical protein
MKPQQLFDAMMRGQKVRVIDHETYKNLETDSVEFSVNSIELNYISIYDSERDNVYYDIAFEAVMLK